MHVLIFVVASKKLRDKCRTSKGPPLIPGSKSFLPLSMFSKGLLISSAFSMGKPSVS